jgi:predicted ferric reductase
MLAGMDRIDLYTRMALAGLVTPTVIVSCACALLLTSHTLPASTGTSFIRKTLAGLRQHPLATAATATTNDANYGRDLALKKVNQFGRGEPDFNVMSWWLIVIPTSFAMLCYLPLCYKWANDAKIEDPSVNEMQIRVEYISYLFGWQSTLCLTFYLIPVTRHSVLLAAMGWSPIHALRIHIWTGYLSFVFMLLHGIILVPVWFIYYDYPVWQQIVPNRQCWTAELDHEDESQPNCYHVFANWTGIVAAVFYIVLWGSSLNWVRRRNYRLFYIFHMVFGTLTILGIILHMYWAAFYFIPSITYYLASTAPTLLQAVASRCRGGVTMRRVVKVPDSGGCLEVHMEAHETAVAEMHREAYRYVKICVPQISLVWHPFDVYMAPPQVGKTTSSTTVRFIFRPVGPFTQKLAERLTTLSDANRKPLTLLVDGFYRGADKCEQALQHDCVTLVAGGVAITPYLSMLPALFQRISMNKDDQKVKTKTIVLHWVCRESGLCTFVVQNYLHRILKCAQAYLVHRPDIEVKVHIYVTGSNGRKIFDSTSNSSASASNIEDSVTLEGSSRTMHVSPPSKQSQGNAAVDSTKNLDVDSSGSQEKIIEVTNTKDEDSVGSEDILDQSDLEDKTVELVSKVESVDGSKDTMSETAEIICANSTGHSLELARMMPRRYANMVWNFPFFVAFSGASWLGVWYLVPPTSDEDPTSYSEYSSMTWITMFVVLMYVALGIIVEATVLGLRKYWPQPTLEDALFNKMRGPEKSVLDVDMENAGNEEVDDDWTNDAAIVYHFSRPTEMDIFADARQAAEPGIFMCGPTGLTGMIKKEARLENSYLGLTRYCLYDEPYEM